MHMNPNTESVKNYYDEHIRGKLKGFVEESRRVVRAWETVRAYAPAQVRRILEVGCGIGDTCWRMSNHWPDAEVVGLDISPKSIETARKLFGSDRVSFREGILTKDTLPGPFDLVVLMDVYEHIAWADRPALHKALAHLLSSTGRIALSFPTPRHLAYLRAYVPGGIQPVDEDIDVHVVAQLAKDTATEVILYKEVNIWHPGDYGHAVLARPIPAWTPESYRQENLKLQQAGKVGRIVGKIINANPLFSRKKDRLRLVREKLGKNAL